MMKTSGVKRTPSSAALFFSAAARRLQVGDIRIFMLRHVRQIDPACLQPRAGNPLDARQRFDFDRLRNARNPPPALAAVP